MPYSMQAATMSYVWQQPGCKAVSGMKALMHAGLNEAYRKKRLLCFYRHLSKDRQRQVPECDAS